MFSHAPSELHDMFFLSYSDYGQYINWGDYYYV